MPLELKVPVVGESITEVEIGGWLKGQGERVQKDEPVVTLESEKATVELPAPESGTITQVLKQKGEVAKVGEVIAYLEKDGQAAGERRQETGNRKQEPERKPAGKPAELKVERKAQTRAPEPKAAAAPVTPAAELEQIRDQKPPAPAPEKTAPA